MILNFQSNRRHRRRRRPRRQQDQDHRPSSFVPTAATTTAVVHSVLLQLQLLLLLLLLLLSHNVLLPVVQGATVGGGIQSNLGEYASGISYDNIHDVVYITGQTGPNQCFVGVIKTSFTTNNNNNHNAGFTFLSKHVFNEQAICQSMTVRPAGSGSTNSNTPSLLLTTTMEEGGLLTNQRPTGSNRATLYGGMIQLDFVDGSAQVASWDTSTSVLMHQDFVQIPVSIVTDATSSSGSEGTTVNRAFVASLTTEDTKTNYEYNTFDDLNGAITPNFTPGGMTKFGKNYVMTISSIELHNEFNKQAQSAWKKPFGAVPPPQSADSASHPDSSVYVKQLSVHRNQLFVVGSTKGTGPLFGGTSSGSTTSGLMAGFISKLDLETGNLISGSDNGDTAEEVASLRLELTDDHTSDGSVAVGDGTTGDNDDSHLVTVETYIDAMCVSPNNNDDDAIYVVGHYEQPASATDSTPAKSVPFAAKLYASSLKMIWKSRFPATTDARAVSCGVDDTIGALYVAGIVQDGGEVLGQTQTHLQDDVFVIRLSKDNGSLTWIQQLGTSGNDHLAQGGSTSSMAVLNNGGGILLFGDTTGNLYSTKSSSTSGGGGQMSHEIFIAHVDADGNLPDTNEVSGVQNTGGGDSMEIKQPISSNSNSGSNNDGDDTASDGGNTGDDGRPPLDPSDETESTPPPPTTTTTEEQSQSSSSSIFYKVLASLAFVGVLGLAFFVTRRRQLQEEKSTERALVFSYLQAFDVEDIDVRHSATGGWHGTYVGKLSQGVNTRGVEDHSTTLSDDAGSEGSGPATTYSHSSIVRDSLFVDYDGGGKTSSSYSDNNHHEYDDDDNDRPLPGSGRQYHDNIDIPTNDTIESMERTPYKDRQQQDEEDEDDDDDEESNPWAKEIV